MNYVEAILVAKARRKGRAVRSAVFRHTRLTEDPLGILLWQLGAEPFTAAAFAWGFGLEDLELAVPGEPRNRQLAFRALQQAADVFNPWFESGEKPDGTQRTDLPQVILPNRGNLTLLRKLGRRLAFLPTDGENPADPELVRFGQHLSFLTEHARTPGQSLVVVLTDLLANHWAAPVSALEVQSLPALDAWIAPAKRKGGYRAALEAENIELGPVPSRVDDEQLDPLLTAFNEARARSIEESVVAPLREPIEAHYQGLVDRGWPILWRAVEREREYEEAEHAQRRWDQDKEALEYHLDWILTKGGRISTRYTNKRAAFMLKKWEDAQALLEAEFALDDPLRMVASMLNNDAVAGTVVDYDTSHTEQGPKNRVKRPLLTLEVDGPCSMPPGKKLWWSGYPTGKHYELRETRSLRSGRTRLVLCLQTNRSAHPVPSVGDTAVFSVHSLTTPFFAIWPDKAPWTHSAAPTKSVEDATEAWEGA